MGCGDLHAHCHNRSLIDSTVLKYEDVAIRVRAQNCQQYDHMTQCCKVNNMRISGKKEQKWCLDASWEGLWVNEMIQEPFCHVDILLVLYLGRKLCRCTRFCWKKWKGARIEADLCLECKCSCLRVGCRTASVYSIVMKASSQNQSPDLDLK